MWPLDSPSGLPNTAEDFEDANLRHSCVPRYRPVIQPTTRQPNNEFRNSRWDIGWHECHFLLKLQFIHSNSTQLNAFNTNAAHCLLEQLEKSALVRNELIGAGQNRQCTVKLKKKMQGALWWNEHMFPQAARKNWHTGGVIPHKLGRKGYTHRSLV